MSEDTITLTLNRYNAALLGGILTAFSSEMENAAIPLSEAKAASAMLDVARNIISEMTGHFKD